MSNTNSKTDIFGDKITESLSKQIDYLNHRHEILSQNIANVSTPKYLAEDIEKPKIFNDNQAYKVPRPEVRKFRLRKTNSKHLYAIHNNSKYIKKIDRDSPMKANKNNVDLSKQTLNLARNSDEISLSLKNFKAAMDLVNMAAGGGR